MMILTAFSEFQETVLSNEYVAALSGYFNMALIPTVTLIYYKFIAPKLARANFINKQFDVLVQKFEVLDAKMEKSIGVNLKLKEDMIIIREAFGIAFGNSNLTQSVKTLLQTVLNGFIKGEKVDVSEELEDMSDSAKEVIEKTVAAVESVVEENKSSALSQLTAEVAALEQLNKEEAQVEEEVQEPEQE